MTTQEYLAAVAQLPYGKTLPTAKYLLDIKDERLPWVLRATVTELRTRLQISDEFNVLKFGLRSPRISFLAYPDFDTVAHPSLSESILVDLISGKSSRDDYRRRKNPPVLHRKDRFVPEDYPRYSEFQALTQAEESAGLLEETSRIGFRLNWEQRLREKGFTIRGHHLLRLSDGPRAAKSAAARAPVIARDRTALNRTEVSKPVKLLLEFKQLRAGFHFFDYGCGHGFDVRALAEMGFSTAGWDPAHAPDGTKRESEVVNLGYVLNVIEDPAERVETLHAAWRYTKKLLVVAALVSGREEYTDVKSFGDGIVTSRSTFQKYFEPAELHALLEDTLEHEAVPVSLGIYFVFRETADLHDFLAARTRRFIDWENLSRRLGIHRAITRRDPYDEHRDLLDAYWQTMLMLGRTPQPAEFDRLDEVRRACGSLPKAFEIFAGRFGEATFAAARARGREDLLVYAGASLLRKRIPFNQLSTRLQNDIKSHFGSTSQVEQAARELLFASGDADELELALGQVREGWIDPIEGHFVIHRDLLDELPGIFRVYVACAARLFGDPKEADLIKIHLHSKKLTFLHYDGFLDEPFPSLSRRIKIDLRRLFVTVFDSPPGGARQVLLFKERFLARSHPARAGCELMSGRLRARGVTPENTGHGPSRDQFEAWLTAQGMDRTLRQIRPIVSNTPPPFLISAPTNHDD